MEKSTQTIYIQALAPTKPQLGTPCNGCGVCCLSEPCPLGMLLSRKRTGACSALRWDQQLLFYRCGALTDASKIAQAALPRSLRFMTPFVTWLLNHTAKRWIAAGIGCDSTLEIHHDATPNTSN